MKRAVSTRNIESAEIKKESNGSKKKKKSLNGFKMKIGSKAEVWHQTAKQTKGGVTRNGLIKNKYGRIIFKSKADAAKRNQNLVKAGYSHRKDHVFGAVFDGVPIPVSIKKKKV